MSTQLLLEEKHVLLKNEIGEKLQKKHALELEITNQSEELKRLEISLEKRALEDNSICISILETPHLF
jgi:hypothetical protein